MKLLNTVALPNGVVAHGLDHMAVFAAGVIKVYAKQQATDTVVYTGVSYALPGVTALAISENGAYIAAQAGGKTYLCKEGIVGTPLNVIGKFSITNSGMIVLANPSAGSVQLITNVTTNLTASLTSKDKVVCGRGKFVVYNETRSLVCGYQEVVLVSETHTKKLMFVSHVGLDEFAYFFDDGSIRCRGKTRTSLPMKYFRFMGNHIIGTVGGFDYSYIAKYPLTRAEKLRESDYTETLIKLVKDVQSPGIIPSSSFLASNQISAPNTFLLPIIPLRTLDVDLNERVRNATPTKPNWPVYAALTDSIYTVGGASDYTTYVTSNSGTSWSLVGNKSPRVGAAFPFKGYLWICTDTTVWTRYTETLTSPTPFSVNPSAVTLLYDNYDHNKNVVVGCTNTSALGANLFVSWNFPNFVQYDMGISTNVTVHYVGMNVFYVHSASVSKLIYVPVTQGAPTVLKTFAKNYTRIVQLGNSIVIVDGELIRAAPYALIENESTATLAQAQAYANEIEAALESTDTQIRSFGVQSFVAPWREQKRLVSGWLDAYQVWQFE